MTEVNLALVVIFLNPIFSYVYHYTRGFGEGVASQGYLRYWAHYFDSAVGVRVWEPGTPSNFDFSFLHIWFITVLFMFFLVTVTIVTWKPQLSLRVSNEQVSTPRTTRLILLLVVVTLAATLGSFSISMLWKNAWVVIAPVLAFISSDMPFHTLYFVMGILAAGEIPSPTLATRTRTPTATPHRKDGKHFLYISPIIIKTQIP